MCGIGGHSASRYAHIIDRDGFAERNAALAGVELTEVPYGVGPVWERVLAEPVEPK
jgi:hypothetical protein